VYAQKEEAAGTTMIRHIERMVVLQVIDTKWKDHLYAMDTLREGISLRAYGQRDPLVEYQHAAYDMFTQMINSIKADSVDTIFKLQVEKQVKEIKGVFSSVAREFVHREVEQFEKPKEQATGEPSASYEPSSSAPASRAAGSSAASHSEAGRNDPCPCGSGKKYKKCCGK